MPNAIKDALRQLILDRYDIDELIEIINPSVNDLLDRFDEELFQAYEKGLLDV